MKKPAHISVLNRVLAVVLITLAALTFATSARAASGNVQVCRPNTTCTIGEFLYNDDYGVINDATCKFTSRYPDGSSFVDNETMPTPSDSDGWYKYDINTPETTGSYRSTICCETGGEKICLDKSFDVQADPAAVAAANTLTKEDVADSVWGADVSSYNIPGSFGSMLNNMVPTAEDIAKETWNYSDRSLSSFENIINQIFKQSGDSVTNNNTIFNDKGSLTTTGFAGIGGIFLLGFLLVSSSIALYVRHKQLTQEEVEELEKESKKKSKKEKKSEPQEEVMIQSPFSKFTHSLGFSVLLLIFGLGIGVASGVFAGKIMFSTSTNKEAVAKTEQKEVLSDIVDAQNEKINEEASKSATLINVEVPEGSSVNVRDLPDTKGIVLTKITQTQEFEKAGEEGDWFQIDLPDSIKDSAFDKGWVSKKFAVEVSKETQESDKTATPSSKNAKTLTILDTPTGFLRIRKSPWGEEIGKAEPGEKYEYLKEDDEWTQIILKDGTGWVYSQYVSK